MESVQPSSGPRAGIDRFWRWVQSIQRPVNDNKRSRPPFPGFEAAFGVPFGARGVFERVVDEESLTNACNIVDVHQRVHSVVHLYSDPIKKTLDEPVTLKFADAVGEILTAGPVTGVPLPFRLYI